MEKQEERKPATAQDEHATKARSRRSGRSLDPKKKLEWKKKKKKESRSGYEKLHWDY